MIRALLCASLITFSCMGYAQELKSFRMYVDINENHFSGILLFQLPDAETRKNAKVVMMSETGIKYADITLKSAKKYKGYLVRMLTYKLVRIPFLQDMYEFTTQVSSIAISEFSDSTSALKVATYKGLAKGDTTEYSITQNYQGQVQQMTSTHFKSGLSIKLVKMDL